jgi:hypothetical protein
MYFKSFPYTYYSQDDRSTVQLITNITTRVVLSDEVKNNLSLYDEYDIKDGETPEILADKYYNNPLLHWIILHTNEILDARFDWPQTSANLLKYIQGKYDNTIAIHHYEDGNGVYTNANIRLSSNVSFGLYEVGNVVVNSSNTCKGYVSGKPSSSIIFLTVTEGGFITGDRISISNRANTTANVTAVTVVSGTPVTVYDYEDAVNETKRRIKILKSAYVDGIVRDFKKKLES